MRAALLLAVVLLLAGCTSNRPAPSPSPTPSLAGWVLDCELGAYENGPWVHPCVARASHSPGAKQEIWLAVNPGDADNVILGSKDNNPESSNRCTWNGLAVTHDGGQTWKDVTIGGRYADRRPGDAYYGFACNTDPMLAFGADGAAHYVVEMYNLGGQDGYGPLKDPTTGRGVVQPGWRIVLATSLDGGDTWPIATTLLVADGVAALHDYSRIAISPTTGTILVLINTYQATTGYGDVQLPVGINTCTLVASRDGGRSADPPVELTDRDDPGADPCHGLTAALDGTFVVGTGGNFGGPQAKFARSVDDGRSWSDLAPGFTIDLIPNTLPNRQARSGVNFDLFHDRSDSMSRGVLYAIYADDHAGTADVYLRDSRDQGLTWPDAFRVNVEPRNDQWMPNGVVARDGSLHALFFDSQWDPGNRLIDVTHAVSRDGGRNWLNERVTAQSFDGDLGQHQENFPFIGDYLGIGTAVNVVWLGFPDTTLGASVIAAARSDLRG